MRWDESSSHSTESPERQRQAAGSGWRPYEGSWTRIMARSPSAPTPAAAPRSVSSCRAQRRFRTLPHGPPMAWSREWGTHRRSLHSRVPHPVVGRTLREGANRLRHHGGDRQERDLGDWHDSCSVDCRSMKQSLRVWYGLVLGASVLLVSPGARVEGAGPTRREAARPRVGPQLNKCGCYRDTEDVCKCVRQSACGCPGQCEPVGCEAERQRDLARRMEEELKSLREAESQKDPKKGDGEPGEGTKPRRPQENGRKGHPRAYFR